MEIDSVRMETRIESGVELAGASARDVDRAFRELLGSGARLLPAGEARADPARLLARRYAPRHSVQLFDARFFLTDAFVDDDIGFLVAYVALPEPGSGRVRRIHPRIFYKDLSLMWRVGTHLVRTDDDNWIGKGDLKVEQRPDGEYLASAEETTNLPLELQGALDDARGMRHPRRDRNAVPLVLRRAPASRIRPYADFTVPRQRAAERYRINGGRRIARFTRRGDPGSLRFATGFEPDFRRGIVEVDRSRSELYGGVVRKYRIVSRNRTVQYQIAASPTHVWMNPPQALTTELSTYGARTIDVLADEELFVPGYEYHYEDEDGLHSQIPQGFAGEPSPIDDQRSDASPWIEELPVIRDFRRIVLGQRRAR